VDISNVFKPAIVDVEESPNIESLTTKEQNKIEVFDELSSMTKDTEVTDSINQSTVPRPSEDNLTELLSQVKNMNFVELTTVTKQMIDYENSLTASKNELDKYTTLVSEIKKNENNLNDSIVKENILEQNGIEETEEEFNSSYDKYMELITQIKEEINKKMVEYEGINKNTEFLTTQLIDIIDKKISALSGVDDSYSDYLLRLRHMKSTLTNRFDYSVLENKITHGGSVKKLKAECIKYGNNIDKRIRRNFSGSFGENQIEKIYTSFTNTIGNKETARVILYHLSKIIKKGLWSDSYVIYNWVKVFLMNVLDMGNGILDNEVEENNLMAFTKNIVKYY
jgi:hypothetical protein